MACEALRQPLEEGEVTVTRALASVRFPARFALIAAANPCPCGHLGDSQFACRCSITDLHRYASRLSGPLLDRIDLYVQAERLTAEELAGVAEAEPTAPVRARVLAARALQRGRQGTENGRLASTDLADRCQVAPAARRTLMTAVDRLGLSARGFHRALRVARTVADLAGADRVEDHHIKEALGLRHLPIIGDREAQLV
jgi:magnesium chelatase family protein